MTTAREKLIEELGQRVAHLILSSPQPYQDEPWIRTSVRATLELIESDPSVLSNEAKQKIIDEWKNEKKN